MSGWRSRARGVLAGGACVLVLGAPAAAAASDGGVEHRTLFRFADRTITESSGLVDAGSVVYTVNDSGAGPQLYAVDPATGETAGVTTYSDEAVTDVEALAPAAGGGVWVGDIGDNARSRPGVSLYRVEPGRDRTARRVDLTYPDGPRDAETLLVHPRSGRVFVVSKTVFGGTVYEAATLDAGRRNDLRPFARVPGLVTDGAFFPDGRHVLLRGYGAASVYSFPGFAPEGTVTLPAQKQGEGVAIGADGRILLSSEGLHAPVLELHLPPALAAVVTGRGGQESPAAPSASAGSSGESGAGSPSRAAEPSAGAEAPSRADSTGAARPDPLWIAAGVALLAALAGLVRATRRR